MNKFTLVFSTQMNFMWTCKCNFSSHHTQEVETDKQCLQKLTASLSCYFSFTTITGPVMLIQDQSAYDLLQVKKNKGIFHKHSTKI
jgi:hypothetical protein